MKLPYISKSIFEMQNIFYANGIHEFSHTKISYKRSAAVFELHLAELPALEVFQK